MPHCIFFTFIICCLVFSSNAADEQALLTLINRLNTDAIELRNEIETNNLKRCDAIMGCTYANYDECLSELSSGKTCPSKVELGYNIDECGSGNSCNGLFDYTATTVRLPNSTVVGNERVPKSPEVRVSLTFIMTFSDLFYAHLMFLFHVGSRQLRQSVPLTKLKTGWSRSTKKTNLSGNPLRLLLLKW